MTKGIKIIVSISVGLLAMFIYVIWASIAYAHDVPIEEHALYDKSYSVGAGFGIGSTSGAQIYEVAYEKDIGKYSVKGFLTGWTSFEEQDVIGSETREVCVKRYGKYRCTEVTESFVIDTERSDNQFVGAAICEDRIKGSITYGGCLGGVVFLHDSLDTDRGLGVYVEGRIQRSINTDYTVAGSVIHGSSIERSDKGITGLLISLKRGF